MEWYALTMDDASEDEVKRVPFDTKKCGKDFLLQKEEILDLMKQLDAKLKRQGEVPTPIDVVARIHMAREQIQHAIHSLEFTLAALDLSGKWKLSDEDWARIQAEQEGDELFRTFLPHMLQYHIQQQVEKDKRTTYKDNCATL